VTIASSVVDDDGKMTGYEPLNTLKVVGPNVWIVDGPVIRFFGLPFSTRMTVIRLDNGDLFVHSPVALSDELNSEVAALGRVRHLVSPNWIHYAYIAQWAGVFSDTLAWAAPGARARAEKMKLDLHFDRDLGESAEAEWAGEIDQLVVHGNPFHQEVVFFHLATKTLIVADLIENFEPGKVSFGLRALAWLGGMLHPNGGMPRDMRATFWRGRNELRDALEQMISWAPERIILAHGRWYEKNGLQELKRAFSWVLDHG